MDQQPWSRPVVLEQGPSVGPVLIVLDSVGGTSLGQLPPAWYPMSECLGVVWLDASALEDPLVDARIVLDQQSAVRSEIYLVADHDGGQLAPLLAAHRPDAVRGVFLVQSGPERPGDGSSAELCRFLAEHGVPTRTAASDPSRGHFGVGHPYAVEAVVRELATLGVGLPESATAPAYC